MTAQEKFSELVRFIYKCDDIAVAFSGGTNSSLLLCAAQEAHGKNIWALTANAAFFTQEELYHVHEVLDDYKLNDARIPVYILQEEKIVQNREERCKTCRRLLSEGLAKAAGGLGAAVLLDGRTNEKPGCVDSREITADIACRSPFVELGFGKRDIYEMLLAVGRGYYLREPAVCLAERFAFGEQLTAAKLDFVEKAEKTVQKFAGKDRCVRFTNWDIVVYTKKDISEPDRKSICAELRKGGAGDIKFAFPEEFGEEIHS